MGLHIYSGSLVRYFTNDWENEIQRLAREKGFEYQAHYSDGEPKWPTREKAAEHIAWMKSSLLAAPETPPGAVRWQDDVDEYHTIKLHEEAREAIMLVSAHLRRPELPMPAQMPASLDDDVAYSEAGSKGYLLDAIAPFEASLVVPGTFARISFLEDPLGRKRLTCASDRLRRALHKVEQEFWRGVVSPEEWLARGLVFARASGTQSEAGEWISDPEPSDSLEGNAEFAFAVYASLLEFSDRHDTAIVTSW